jgi:DNA-binding transcriptional regulator GbsR (MarR family)
MGHGGQKMGTPKKLKDSKDTRDTESTVDSVEEFFERVRSQSRELDMVVGSTKDAIQQSDNRRVESLQRSFDEKIQDLEKTLKELREAYYPDRHPYPPGDE